MEPQDDWSTKTDQSMVSVGTHNLLVSVSGIPRSPGDPIVICLPGAGDVAASYLAVTRRIQQSTRILLYDRSGFGRSEARPVPACHEAVETATELHSLLGAMGIAGPLLLVAHSYGGIVAREYLNLYPEDVGGMVLVESATERQHTYFQVPDPNITAVLGTLNYARTTGLRDESKLSQEEWRERAIDISGGVTTGAAQREVGAFVEVCETLAAKKQFERQAMGDKPLGVIRGNSWRDYQRIYDLGVEAGNGTSHQRNVFRELLDSWKEKSMNLQEEQLQLSSNSRLIDISDCGHHVHIVRPDVVCEEVNWVRDQIIGQSKSSLQL